MPALDRAPSSKFWKILVRFERREDGGLRVSSEDVPGFVLSHSDADAALADVKPALENILSHICKARVEVEPLPHLRAQLCDAGVIDDLAFVPGQAPCTREYVTHVVN